MIAAVDTGDVARAELADLIDLQLRPLGMPALEVLAPAAGQAVLDVGCGAGGTTMLLAHRVGADGRAIGVDIAPRVLAVARNRTAALPQVSFIQGDATALDLSDESFDGIYSRFGMTAFSEPVRAFSNLHRMLKHGGHIAFACWRPLRENELDLLPLQAAEIDIAVENAPFSLSNRSSIRAMLSSAGFQSIAVRPFDAAVSCGDIKATLTVLTRVGALGQLLRKHPHLAAQARSRLARVLSARAGDIHLNAAVWIVSATR